MNINWSQLRDKFFKECATETPREYEFKRVNLAAHDMFEWFKKEIMQYVSSPSSVDLRVTQIPPYEKMSEQQLIDIGFVLIDQYAHDEFHTKRFKKGIMIVEFTYDANTLLTSELTLDELYCHPVSFAEITQLDPVLGKLDPESE